MTLQTSLSLNFCTSLFFPLEKKNANTMDKTFRSRLSETRSQGQPLTSGLRKQYLPLSSKSTGLLRIKDRSFPQRLIFP